MRYFLEKLTRAPDAGGAGGDGNQQQQQQAGDGADISTIVTDVAPGQDPPSQAAKDGDLKSQAARNKGLFADQNQQQQEQQQQQQTTDDGRPEGIPDKFWNAKDKIVNIDAMSKAYSDLEKAHSKLMRAKAVGGEIPENVGDYFTDEVKLPDTVDRLSVAVDDPGLQAFATACQKYGIGKDAARSIVVDMFVAMNDYAPAPMDPEAERKALGKEGPAMYDGLWGWAENMEKAGALSGDDVDVFEGLMASAKGVKFLAKVRGMTGLEPIPITPGSGQTSLSPSEWQMQMAEAIKTKNYAEQARLEKLGEGINGTHAAGTSRGGSLGFAG